MNMRTTYQGVCEHWCIRMLFIAFFTTAAFTSLIGQDENAGAPAEDAPKEEEVIKSRMALTVNQFPDSTLELNALLRARIDGAYQKVPNANITFFNLSADGAETAIGELKSGANGIATIKVDAGSLSKDSEGYLSFIARFDGNDEMTGSEGDLRIQRAILEMTPVPSDSSYAVALSAVSLSGDSIQPIANAVVSVFVKRMFSSLKVGEGTTDETGSVEITFPNDLAGDQDANLEITAIIEETEEFGNLSTTMTQKWGYAVSYEFTQAPRALWSPHPPKWMVITFFVLMVAVWGHYIVIIYQLFRIKSQKSFEREGAQIET